MLKSTTGRADFILFMVGEESAASHPAKHEGQEIWNCSRTKHFKSKYTRSRAPLCQTWHKSSAFPASYTFISFSVLLWLDHSSQTSIITSQTTIDMLKCKYCIQTRSWKNWLRGEQDFQKHLDFRSTQTNFPNPLKPILFLTLQALHSLCIHFLPHTGPTQSSTSAGLQKSSCRTSRKPDWCPTEHWYHPPNCSFQNIWEHSKTLPFYTSRKPLHYGTSKHEVLSLIILIRGNRPLNRTIKEH